MTDPDRPDPTELNPEIMVQSIVSSVTFDPYVQIRGASQGQWTPEEASEFASGVFAAACAAEYDSFLYHYLTEIGLSVRQVGQIILAFRKARGDPSPKDWRK